MSHVYTIGHSNHAWYTFAALLRLHHTEAVVDIRSRPASRHAPFANRRRLQALLEPEGISYCYLGESLGGKPSVPSLYDKKGLPNYEKIAARATFAQGIETVLKLVEVSRIVIMCAEENPASCHRRLMIGPALKEREVEMRHIRRDGSVMIEAL